MEFTTTIEVTSDFLRRLNDQKVGFNSQPPVIGTTIALTQHQVERYSLHNSAVILPLGAFSYCDGFNDRLQAGLIRSIGRYCSIAVGTKTIVTTHPTNWLSTHPFQYSRSRFADKEYFDLGKNYEVIENFKTIPDDIHIGNDVWIGMSATIIGGVSIGDGAIVCNNAVVAKDVEPYSIVGGIAARTIRTRFPPEIVSRLLELRWWDYHYKNFQGIQFSHIERAVIDLERRLPSCEKMPVQPAKIS